MKDKEETKRRRKNKETIEMYEHVSANQEVKAQRARHTSQECLTKTIQKAINKGKGEEKRKRRVKKSLQS